MTTNARVDGGERPMMRRDEAADYLGISRSLLSKMAMRGDGPPMIRVSRQVVCYDPSDLDTWLAARKVTSTSEVIDAA